MLREAIEQHWQALSALATHLSRWSQSSRVELWFEQGDVAVGSEVYFVSAGQRDGFSFYLNYQIQR